MFPSQHKITDSATFRKVIRNGKRAGRSTVVVHLYRENYAHSTTSSKDATAYPHITTGGPRCGLIVSKAVGNAVKRHHLSRWLRVIIMDQIKHNSTLRADRELLIVVRLLAPASTASFSQMQQDVSMALEKAYSRLTPLVNT
ncbi:ribonuclease P protein component [Corynebacterium sp. sy017]|uniref:ribonuclease P protein component n=1 Tax=unclassified Corynebacterium TaxID=2624378 RepID=UPI001184B86A|nr:MULTISPECIES: ribonuclease P protein component [unclassified Corynebacterium]MBP3088266.1 ribonuclease P protein component [Corynebacterium sp. sy017]QDZ43445.1 ribonuclease P protein component [Corynebacterium sp. sy039]TSD91591.1 ribonuclease P protein component [Corynebacterium sp. SY003]